MRADAARVTRCMLSSLELGIALIEKGLHLFRAIGASTPLSFYLCHLANAHLRSGATESGLIAVEEGLKLAAVSKFDPEIVCRISCE